jgi:hypothetical protein
VRGKPLAESAPTRRRNNLGESLLASLFFLAATIVFTWPIAPRAATGLADLWDAKLTAWILHWDYHQSFRDPLHLFDANIFHPSRYSLAFSENLFGAALFAFPLYAMGLSTLTVYNVVFLLGMFFSGIAAWALARNVTGDPVASAVAGLVFAFCPWRIAQIPHIQFQWGAFLALSLLFLLRYLDTGRRRDLVFFGICLAWNALCNVHYALFSGFLIGATLLYEGLAAEGDVFRARLPGVAGAMFCAAIVLIPFLIPYALASHLYGMQRGFEEIDVYSGVWKNFLAAGGQNKLYATLTQKWDKAEGELFPGVVALALAAVALFWRRRPGPAALRQASPPRRRVARVFDVLFLASVALWIAALAGRTSVGPLKLREPGRIAVVATVLLVLRLAAAFPAWSRFSDLGDFLRRLRAGTRVGLFFAITILGVVVALGTHTPFYRFLVQSFGPIFRVIRAPSRGVVLFDLGLSVLAAWGLSALIQTRKRGSRFLLASGAIVLIGLEYRAFPFDVARVEARPAPVYEWLATASFPGGLVEWPLGTWYDQEHEFRSTAHWKPILNGASGFSPRSYDELAATLEKKPIPDEIWGMLEERKATRLLFHSDELEGESATSYAEAIRRGMDQGKMELLRAFPHGDSHDFLFRLSWAPRLTIEPAALEESRRDQALLEAVLRPPFGYIDLPGEGEQIGSGASVVGWALDDSGVARVTVAVDAGPAAPALYGLAHPGPPKVYRQYPDVERAGFAFSLPALSAGPHTLTVTILARDGGKAVMKRNVVGK